MDQTSFLCLGLELIRVMKKGGCEKLRPAGRWYVLAVCQLASAHLEVLWIIQPPPCQSNMCGGIARNAYSEQDPSWA